MTREELDDALYELLNGNYHIAKNKKGQLTIITHLVEDEFGELIAPDDADEDAEDFDGEDEPYIEDDSDE